MSVTDHSTLAGMLTYHHCCPVVDIVHCEALVHRWRTRIDDTKFRVGVAVPFIPQLLHQLHLLRGKILGFCVIGGGSTGTGSSRLLRFGTLFALQCVRRCAG